MKKGRKSIGSSETFKEYDIFKVDKGLFIADSDKFPYIQDETNHIWAYANKWAEDKDVHLDESFDKNKGCKFEFDQEYVFVNLKHTRFNTPQAKCDVHRIDVNAINNEKTTIAVYRILGICDVHRI